MSSLTPKTIPSIRAHFESAKADPEYAEQIRAMSRSGKRQTLVLLFQPPETSLVQDFWRSQVLARQGVPPSLHWVRPVSYPGHQLVQFDADLLWLFTHHRHRIRRDSSWAARLVADEPADRLRWSDRTHALVTDFVTDWDQVPSLYEENWQLTNTIRGQLALTSRARAPARIPPGIVGAWRDALTLHAAQHKDRQGRYPPVVAAARRTIMLIIHMKSGQNVSNTAKYWNTIMREDISRQAVEKHLQVARGAVSAAGWEQDWLSTPNQAESP